MNPELGRELAHAEGRVRDGEQDEAARHHLAQLVKSCEQSLALAIAGFIDAGTAYDATLTEGSDNVVKVTRQGGLEVQLIVKVGSPHEVRDDVWDALMDRMDVDVSTTQLANAAMERLGFPTPDGGWPK